MKIMWTTEVQILNGHMIVTVDIALQAIANNPPAPPNFFSGLQQDSDPWPLHLRCISLPFELWRAGRFVEFILTREGSETWNMHLI